MDIKQITPDKLLKNLGKYSIEEAQEIINIIPYNYDMLDTELYRVSSPIVTISNFKAMCLDSDLLGAALTGVEPLILYLEYVPDESPGHAVLLIKDKQTKKFGSIGMSGPILGGKPTIYNSVESLAKTYDLPGDKVKGYNIYNYYHINSGWLDSERDLNQFGKNGWNIKHFLNNGGTVKNESDYEFENKEFSLYVY